MHLHKVAGCLPLLIIRVRHAFVASSEVFCGA